MSSSTTQTVGVAGSSPAIAAATTMGAVSLTVSDLARSRALYEDVIGLRPLAEGDDGSLVLGGPDGTELVRLHPDAAAPALNRRATGLFHLAILLPTRADLGHFLLRLANAGYPLDGASDHLVSEALYLSDPDGNGIEIYRDRPRDEWRRDSSGALEMATLALDLRSIVADAATGAGPDGPAVPSTVPAGTVMGHVHLQVADLASTEAFYSQLLGFDVMVRGYPGALFVAAGGYHHHLGLNTWHSAGSGPAQPGAVGLRSYEVRLPTEADREAVLNRIRHAGLPLETDDRGATAVRDPSGNLVALVV